MEPRNVLYPTDLSPCSRQAFPHALELAQRYGACLHIVHVVAVDAGLPYGPAFAVTSTEVAYERVAREVAGALAALVGEARARGVVAVAAQPRELQVGPALLAYARQHDVDLVVMGTHGRRGAARLLLGSLAAEVLRYSSCPVLIVRERDDQPGRPATPRRVLVPFDFSAPSRLALADAADLARRCGAGLRLLHVLEEAPAGAAATVDAPAEEQRARAVARLRLRLRDVLAYLAPGVEGDVEVRVGRAAEQIVRDSEEAGADLLVMAAGGANGVRRLLFGSTSEAVLHASSAPVLVVKGEQRDTTRVPLPHRVAARREEPAMRVMDVMQWQPRVATPEMSLARVGQVMEEAGCGFLPVVGEGQRVVGVITDRDVCLALTGADRAPSSVAVGQVLRGEVWACGAEDRLASALETMAARQVRRLPVLGREGRLAGILSLDDVVEEARPGSAVGHPSFEQVGATLQAICRHALPALR